MRRLMFKMTQEKLGETLGLSFQQVQKYEKGTNRISASKLQQISNVLHVPVSFFFEGAPPVPGQRAGLSNAPTPAFVTEFLALSDGQALVQAFTRIKSRTLRKRVLDLVQQISR